MGQAMDYFVRVTRRGQSNERFGWAICRQDTSLEVKRSTETFETRIEALLDSVREAQLLAFPLDLSALLFQREQRGSSAVDQPTIPRKQFDIDKAIALGFTSEAVRQLMDLAESKTSSCAEVAAVAEQQLEDIKRTADLQDVANALTLLLGSCTPALPIAQCPIIRALTGS
jgi:hypothetical protein